MNKVKVMDRKYLLYLLLTVTTLMLIYLFYATLIPRFNEISNLNQQLSNKQRVLKVMENDYQNYENNKEEILKRFSELIDLEKYIVPKNNIIKALIEISEMFDKFELVELDFSMDEYLRLNNENFSELNIFQVGASFSVSGKYYSVANLLKELKSAKSFYKIESLKISSENVTDEDNVRLDIMLTIFSMDDSGVDETELINDFNEAKPKKSNPFNKNRLTEK